MDLPRPDGKLSEPLRESLGHQGAAMGPSGAPAWGLAQKDCLAFLDALPPESVDLIATDPAYSGMNEHLKFGHGRIVGRYGDPGNTRWMQEFRDSPDGFRRFLLACHRVLAPDRHLYVMFDSFSLLSLGHLVREVFAVKNLIAWDKVALGMGHYFRRRHEFIVFASKGRRKLAHRAFPDVWQVRRLVRGPYPTQKPREVFEIMIAASTGPGEIVCDPFCGAGTACIAALALGRGFVGCDVDRRAHRTSVGRVEDWLSTGLDPLQPRSHLPPGVKPFWR